MMVKYFILKDFINYPTGISKGEYDENGNRLKGWSTETPSKLSDKFKGFDTIEEILNYEYCKCGKPDCTHNARLKEIVEGILSNKNIHS